MPEVSANIVVTHLPVRYCHGCTQVEDQPRCLHVSNVQDAAADKLYHYDCVPADVAEQHPETHEIVNAARRGVHGAKLRELATKHARSIEPAPADKE
jgi:hypothetical protein